jgi:hypothetical protein
MPARIDITGHRFGRLVVIERAPQSGKRAMWRCGCDCGNETIVQRYRLKTSKTKSCGCLNAEYTRARFTTHGHRVKRHSSPTYSSWLAMIQRCTNPNDKTHWKYYGGRGITICDRWRHSFEDFLADVGERPIGLTLERTNNELGYFPGNVRWASRLEQALNRRPASKLTAEQVIAIRADPRPNLRIAEQYHVTRSTIGEIKRRETWKHIP